ncbi:MAG: hypothetical protein K0S39_5467 [Paenibacillus sp.]|jgi:uncharacterized protein YggT (Ycf19 family)|nr:hypothetical protein [Paenibacillus sp.]
MIIRSSNVYRKSSLSVQVLERFLQPIRQRIAEIMNRIDVSLVISIKQKIILRIRRR